ncbi:hypothetical protein G9A89_013999 [Geosiphon pyriformis]|nr:hypothetical protein G9A89_013999 [Geosiphon pyriformis]
MEVAFEHQVMGTPVNTESARETFYRELIQNTNLPTNHNFASIITEINKEIEHHTQQRYPITYVSKSKGKLQTPAVTPRKIQPPTWKKNRIESQATHPTTIHLEAPLTYHQQICFHQLRHQHLDDFYSKVDKGKQNY